MNGRKGDNPSGQRGAARGLLSDGLHLSRPVCREEGEHIVQWMEIIRTYWARWVRGNAIVRLSSRHSCTTSRVFPSRTVFAKYLK